MQYLCAIALPGWTADCRLETSKCTRLQMQIVASEITYSMHRADRMRNASYVMHNTVYDAHN